MNRRLWGRAVRIAVAVLTLLLTGVLWVEAGPLYGATGSKGVSGELVILNPATGGMLTDIGPLVDGSSNPYGITGLAFQPGTGVLFGSTANLSPTAPRHLVTINPVTAQVSDVGSFGVGSETMADITFDPTSGILYGLESVSGNLCTINLTTGAATSLRIGNSKAILPQCPREYTPGATRRATSGTRW